MLPRGAFRVKLTPGIRQLAPQVCVNVQRWRTPEAYRSKEPNSETCIVLRQYAKRP